MMDAVIYCPWCGETVRVMERTARCYANQDGTPHICGPHREPVHAMATSDAPIPSRKPRNADVQERVR